MASQAQVAANRENAQHSTGPKTEEGKEASSKNNFRHGLTGHGFFFLEWESAEDYDQLKLALAAEHQPSTPTEKLLVEKMAQHYWLSQRSQQLQTIEMKDDPFDDDVQRRALGYLRYQIQHERLFQRALHDLLKLRAEKRKAEIGFESQKRAAAQETRRKSAETRKVERHAIDMDIRKNRLEREQLRTTGSKHVSAPPQTTSIAA